MQLLSFTHKREAQSALIQAQANGSKEPAMTYFVISPKILECSAPASGQVDCAVTFDMEEYGIHTNQAYCQFSLTKAQGGQDEASIRVKDMALSMPLYDAFWRGFYSYVMNTLRLDVFDENSATGRARRFYLSDVHFEASKHATVSPGVKVYRN